MKIVRFSHRHTEIKKYFTGEELSSVSTYADLPHRVYSEPLDLFYDSDLCTTVIRGGINARTAQIDLEIFIVVLYNLKKERNFKKLEFLEHYSQGTAEEVMKRVLQLEAEEKKRLGNI